MRSIRPRSSNSPSASAGTRLGPRPRNVVELTEAEPRAGRGPGGTRSPRRPRRRGRRRPGSGRARAVARRCAVERGAPIARPRTRRAARRSARSPAPDVAGPRDRVVARRLAVEALERVVDDAAEPERVGVGLERAAARARGRRTTCTSRSTQPSSELALKTSRARRSPRGPSASAQRPGQRGRVGQPFELGRGPRPRSSAPTPSRSSARGAPSRGPASASARASSRGGGRLAGRRARPARARARVSSRSSAPRGRRRAGRGPRRRTATAPARRAVLVAALPAQYRRSVGRETQAWKR